MSVLCKIRLHSWYDYKYIDDMFYMKGRVCLRCGRVESAIDSEFERYHLDGYISDPAKFRKLVAERRSEDAEIEAGRKQSAEKTILGTCEIAKQAGLNYASVEEAKQRTDEK